MRVKRVHKTVGIYKKYKTPKPVPKVTTNKKLYTVNRVRLEFIMDAVRDADIVDKLNSVPNKSDYIRNLIRADIKKGTQ